MMSCGGHNTYSTAHDYRGTYQFSDDWFSPNIPQWCQLLTHLDGTPCKLIELGTHEGRSAFWMAENLLSHCGARLTCVDSWRGWAQPYYKRFLANLWRCERVSQISVRADTIYQALTRIAVRCEGPFNFAYIDASHDACDLVQDFALVIPLMAPGGLICLDDYEWTDGVKWGEHRSPRFGIDFILEAWGARIELVHKSYQVWVRICGGSS